MKGIGCSKLRIADTNLKDYFTNQDTPFCHPEMRKHGLLIGFRDVLRIYYWAIPYRDIEMSFHNVQWKISDAKYHMILVPPFNGNLDHNFIHKIKIQIDAKQ